MKAREQRYFEMFRRVYDFCVGQQTTPTHTALRDPPPVFWAHVQALKGVIDQLGELGSWQGNGRPQFAVAQRNGALQKLLDQYLRPLRLVARSQQVEIAGLEQFVVPKMRAKLADVTAQVRTIADAVERYPELLADAGIPEDCPAQLRCHADALDAAYREADALRQRRAESTVAIAETVREGQRICRLLDAVIRRICAEAGDGGIVTLTNWEGASHRRRDPVRATRRLVVDAVALGEDEMVSWEP